MTDRKQPLRAFPYYGSKARIAKFYPEPQHRTICEPFAGAAAYSQRYWEHDVILNDLNPNVVRAWEFLITAKRSDILALPNVHYGLRLETLTQLSDGERALMGFYSYDGFAGVAGRAVGKRCLWNDRKAKLAELVFHFDHWHVFQMSWDTLPQDAETTWFIDPPYQFGGEHYTCSNRNINFAALAAWCRGREGQVIVCENTKATWLPFRPLVKLHGIKHTTTEAVFP